MVYYYVNELMNNVLYMHRSRSWSHSPITEDSNGHKQIRVWNLSQGFPKGPKPSTPSQRAQPSLEAEAKNKQRSKEASLCVSREDMCPSPPFKGPGRPNWDKEALLQKARWEEVEVREVLKALCCSVRLESTLKNMWHQRIQMWLWHYLLTVSSHISLYLILWITNCYELYPSHTNQKICVKVVACLPVCIKSRLKKINKWIKQLLSLSLWQKRKSIAFIMQ